MNEYEFVAKLLEVGYKKDEFIPLWGVTIFVRKGDMDYKILNVGDDYVSDWDEAWSHVDMMMPYEVRVPGNWM